MKIDIKNLRRMTHNDLEILKNKEIRVKTNMKLVFSSTASDDITGKIVDFQDAANHPNLPGSFSILIKWVDNNTTLAAFDKPIRTIYFTQVESIEIIDP